MRTFFYKLVIVLIATGFSVDFTRAQSQITLQNNGTNNSDAKASYVAQQNYLSASSLKDYKSYYGDSLKGFDEKAAKAYLLSQNVFGEEYVSYIKVLKRRFLNEKYGLIQAPVAPAVLLNNTMPVGGGKTLGGGNNVVNVAPCVNEDFEATPFGAVTTNTILGWSVFSQAANCATNGAWSNGSTELSIVATPILNFPCVGTIPVSPLGGSRVAQIGNFTSNSIRTKISTTFPVTAANALFQFAFAGFYQNPGHACCDQPGFFVRVLNCTNTPLNCSNVVLSPGCPAVNATFSTCAGGSWTNWQVKNLDLTPYIGTCVTFECWTSDCSFGGHYGVTAFDAICGAQFVGGVGMTGNGGTIAGPVSFCAGSNLATIAAPLGYASYTWTGPPSSPVSAAQASLSTISVNNPTPGTVYTVAMTSPGGCLYTATNAINPSTVAIVGLGTTTTCINGASGSASVQGNGSGSGYTYTWTSLATNAVVGSASVATGLAPGIYSIAISGLGSAGCGSSGATVAIVTGPQALIPIAKPFCGNIAYLTTSGGSNFKWYNNATAITGTAGTVNAYTVSPASSGQVFHLSYLSVFGCQDSIKFTLFSSPPGQMQVSGISLVCPGASNGTAVVSMTPAVGSPPGANSFSVVNSSTATPAFNASVFPTSANSLTLTGLSAGNYLVKTFDGSCNYNSNFNLNTLLFNYTLSPQNLSLCPGNQINAGVSFSVPTIPGQYTYSWSPGTWLAGGATNLQNTIISPTTAPGTISTVVYTVEVTPTILACPITKTMAVTAINPPTPTITAIPNMCDISQAYQIQVAPGGGTFASVGVGAIAPINALSGVLSPTFALNGLNTFTYSIKVNTCIATQTSTYQVSKFYTAALTSSVPPQCVTNVPFNLMTIVQNTANGTWSGPGVAGTSFVPGNLQTNNYVLTYSTFSSPNPTVCPSNTVLNVSVTSTITPTITAVPPFCNNAAPFTMVTNPPGGVWSGNSALSAGGLVTPSGFVATNKIASVTVPVGPCLNTSSYLFDVSFFNTAALTGSIPNLCGNNPAPFNLMSVVQSSVNGTWLAPQGIISNSFFPAGIATNTYALTYSTTSTPNTTLCPDSRTIAISVLNPPVPYIHPVGPFCSKEGVVQLSVTPGNGQWVASSYLGPDGVFTPSLAGIGNNLVQYVIGTSTCNSQFSRNIPVESFESAFITKPIQDLCNTGSPVNLTPYTQSNKGVWSGSGISGTIFNPGVSGAGSYVLTYNTSSYPSGLCPDQATLSVNVYSLAAPSITKVKRVCTNSEPVKLQVSPLGGMFGGLNTSAVNSAGMFNPGLAVIGNNIVNYSITVGPCVAYGQTTVEVEQFVPATLIKEPKSVYCQTIDQPLNLNDFVANPGGTWEGDAVIAGSSMFDPMLARVGSNNVITYRTHSTTYTLCPDNSTLRLTVGDVPKVTTDADKTSGCAPLEVVLKVKESDRGKATWNLGDGTQDKEDRTISHVYTAPGQYTATLSYVSSLGCPAVPLSVNPTFTVYESPRPDFSVPDEILISEGHVQMTNLTSEVNSNKYIWKLDNQDIGNDINQDISYNKIGRYNVTLVAESAEGCKSEISKAIEVKNEFNVFIPSSFSPNFDGLNDVFAPVFTAYGLDMKSFEMEIFDRWGHSLYRTRDVNKGWDGTLNNSKGEPLKEEVYVYKIKYKDMEGNLYNKIGHVSLLR